jgi:CRISPR system Cascade subunit CasA
MEIFMPINLIDDPWLPTRRLSGDVIWIPPGDIVSERTDDPIVALNFPRPDWNAAVTELLIGWLTCVMAPEDTGDWVEVWETPPTQEGLGERLAPLAFAFNLGGDGPRCFQDYEPLAACEEKPISALLIDAPGANALVKNVDLFIKRAEELVLSPAYAAAALITMQTYAPAGGQGNRTSMRGGGPLTTLPLPKRQLGNRVVTTLWDTLWASVPNRDEAAPLPANGSDAEWAKVFPWLAPARTSEKDRPTLPEHAHPLQCYFAAPRRIRMDFTPANGALCSLNGKESETLARSFRQKNYGVKYDGWVHPHSPYYSDKKAGKLPYHPQPGGATYRDWMTWVTTPSDGATERAATVTLWADRIKWLPEVDAGVDAWQSGLLACGFDMDNMKARGWLEARIPYFHPPKEADALDRERWSSEFVTTAKRLVAGAEEAGTALRYRTRLARFGSCDRENGVYSLPKTSPGKNAYDDLYETFWRETESDFREALIKLTGDPADEGAKARREFLHCLRRKALNLFDEAVGTDDLADQDARRIVDSRWRLGLAFGETGGVRQALGLVTAEAQKKAAKRRAAKKKKEPTT